MKSNLKINGRTAGILKKSGVAVLMIFLVLNTVAQPLAFDNTLTASVELPKADKEKNKPVVKASVMVFEENVKDISVEAIQAFAVPTDKMLNIEINEGAANRVLTVFNSRGMRMQNIPVNKTGGSVTIDVAAFRPGTYTAEVNGEDGSKLTRTFVIQ